MDNNHTQAFNFGIDEFLIGNDMNMSNPYRHVPGFEFESREFNRGYQYAEEMFKDGNKKT
jgi:hypothetical protein